MLFQLRFHLRNATNVIMHPVMQVLENVEWGKTHATNVNMQPLLQAI